MINPPKQPQGGGGSLESGVITADEANVQEKRQPSMDGNFHSLANQCKYAQCYPIALVTRIQSRFNLPGSDLRALRAWWSTSDAACDR